MNVLIVVESCFGNTATVARAVESGLREQLSSAEVSVVGAADAPTEIPAGLDLLLVGAPTHNFSLPRAGSREQAVRKGATGASATGVREWIARATPSAGVRTETFDTSYESTSERRSAAGKAAKRLRKRGFEAAARGDSFRVGGMAGPLRDGEEERARRWGAQLGRQLATGASGSEL